MEDQAQDRYGAEERLGMMAAIVAGGMMRDHNAPPIQIAKRALEVALAIQQQIDDIPAAAGT